MSKKSEHLEEQKPNSRYHYVGKGRGVLGLPHDVSMEEARARGVEKILEAAIKNGRYELAGENHDSPELEKIQSE